MITSPAGNVEVKSHVIPRTLEAVMSRFTLLVPLLVLVACSDAVVGPDSTVPPPSMLRTVNGEGGITFTADSGCTYDAQTQDFTCSYTIQGLDTEQTYTVWLAARWVGTYQCVHANTRKAHRNYPPTDYFDGVNQGYPDLSPSGSGEIIGSDQVLDGPPTLAELCAGTKGAFTGVQILSGPDPDVWAIYVENLDGTAWAQLISDEF